MKKILSGILLMSLLCGSLSACQFMEKVPNNANPSYKENEQNSEGMGGSSDKEDESAGGGSGVEQDGEKEDEGTHIILGSYATFKDGRARVAYYENNEKRYALIDTQGNYLYDVPLTWRNIGKGAGYATKLDEEDDFVYEIINSKGEVVANSKERGFEKILGYGEGQAIVYQYKRTLTSVEHLYGVIDVEDGSWVYPMRDTGIDGTENIIAEYCGGDIFYMGGKYYNMNTNQWFSVYHQGEMYYVGKKFVNNAIYYRGGEQFYIIYSDGREEILPDYFALYTDGTYQAVEAFSSVSNGKVIRNIGEEKGYVEIYDIKTGKTIEYKDYSADMVQSVEFFNSYGLVTLKGVDGTAYFTLIDENGTQQFEPIAGSTSRYSFSSVVYVDHLYYSDGKIVYKSPEYDYNVINEKDEKLITKKDYKIEAFSDGIALASYAKVNSSDERDYFFINEKGETILTKMFKN